MHDHEVLTCTTFTTGGLHTNLTMQRHGVPLRDNSTTILNYKHFIRNNEGITDMNEESLTPGKAPMNPISNFMNIFL